MELLIIRIPEAKKAKQPMKASSGEYAHTEMREICVAG
jgi:hypothetical protein